eukprot:718129-Rhodomonas_salina.4
MAVRRKEYREYWCGFFRCFWCALWYNGNKFHKWTSITQIVLFVFTILAPLLPWLKISYETGNHLERVRKVFDFIDGNSNNVLEFEELSAHLKDMNFVFFGGYFRNDVVRSGPRSFLLLPERSPASNTAFYFAVTVWALLLLLLTAVCRR